MGSPVCAWHVRGFNYICEIVGSWCTVWGRLWRYVQIYIVTNACAERLSDTYSLICHRPTAITGLHMHHMAEQSLRLYLRTAHLHCSGLERLHKSTCLQGIPHLFSSTAQGLPRGTAEGFWHSIAEEEMIPDIYPDITRISVSTALRISSECPEQRRAPSVLDGTEGFTPKAAP